MARESAAARAAREAEEREAAMAPESQGDAGEKAVEETPVPEVETAEPSTAPEVKRRKPYFSV